MEIKLSELWQSARLKSIVSPCVKFESWHLAYSPVSESRDVEEPEFPNEEEDTGPEATVQGLGTDVDATLGSLTLPNSEEQVSQRLQPF